MPAVVTEDATPFVVRSELAPSARNRIFLYLGLLILLRPFDGIWGLTATSVLKDHLHLKAGAVAGFWFYAGIPAYLGFLFGLVRDRWAPFGRRDQGLLLLAFGGMSALFLALGSLPLAFALLMAVALTKAILDQLASSAQQGLTSVLGQEHVMSGRLSALWQAAGALPLFVTPLIAGYCSDHLPPRTTFLVTAAICLGLFGFSFWRPMEVYNDPAERAPIPPRSFLSEAVRLAKTPAIFPCVLLLLLWNFTPGVGTPIQYYLIDTLHGSMGDYGRFNALFNGFFLPTLLLHGFLCTRYRLRPILWISTCVAVPQILPLLMVHSASSAVWAAIPMGLMGGFATAAYFDLLIRACPAGLQGTAMMLGAAVWALSGAFGNIAGAHLYEWRGFPACAWATAAVYSCQLLVIPFVPKRLTNTSDGEIAATSTPDTL